MAPPPKKNPRRSSYRWLRMLLAVLFVALAIAFGAYFEGFWVPNGVSRAEYPVQGIDVSRHQGAIDWSRVPTRVVQFVYIKATEGGDFRDDRFAANWKASRADGLRRGAYHYFTFKTPGSRQADNFITTVPNDPEALPPAVDVEIWGNSADRPAVADFQRELSAFIAKVRQHYGTEPVIYAARDFRSRYLAGFPQPRLWLRAVVASPRLAGISHWTFWQFSERGRIPGINGFVDRNAFDGTPEEFAAFCRRER